MNHLPALFTLLASCSLLHAVQPNVLLILADDLKHHDLSFTGSKDIPTPHIDALAASGVHFTNAYCTAPLCAPSRAGLLTGRNQARFGTNFRRWERPQRFICESDQWIVRKGNPQELKMTNPSRQ